MKQSRIVQYVFRPSRRGGGSLKPALRLTGKALSVIGLEVGSACRVTHEGGRIIIEAVKL